MPLLLARCNSLLVQLSEFGKPPILDTLASTGPGKARLHLFVATASSLAQRFLSPAPFPEFDESEVVPVSGTTRSQLPPSKSSARQATEPVQLTSWVLRCFCLEEQQPDNNTHFPSIATGMCCLYLCRFGGCMPCGSLQGC